jgi:hypothetical protein
MVAGAFNDLSGIQADHAGQCSRSCMTTPFPVPALHINVLPVAYLPSMSASDGLCHPAVAGLELQGLATVYNSTTVHEYVYLHCNAAVTQRLCICVGGFNRLACCFVKVVALPWQATRLQSQSLLQCSKRSARLAMPTAGSVTGGMHPMLSRTCKQEQNVNTPRPCVRDHKQRRGHPLGWEGVGGQFSGSVLHHQLGDWSQRR